MPIQQVSTQPVRIANVGETGVIVNRSATTPVFWGLTASECQSADASILGALDAISTDGSAEIYIASLSSPGIPIDFMQGGVNRAVQNINATVTNATINVAGSVSISGTPNVTISGTAAVDITGQSVSLDVSAATVNVDGVGGLFPVGSNTLLQNMGSQTVGANNFVLSNIFDMLNYTAFNVSGYVYCTSQSSLNAPLTATVQFTWYADVGLTQAVEVISGVTWVGNSNSALFPFSIQGPCHARYLQIKVLNLGNVNATLNNMFIYGTGRNLANTIWHQNAPYGFMNSGLTMFGSGGFESANMPAALLNASLPANSTMWYPLCLINKSASIRLNTSVLMNQDPVIAIASGLTVNGGLHAGLNAVFGIWNPGNVATNDQATTLELPPQPCYLVLNSTSTAATVSLVASTKGV